MDRNTITGLLLIFVIVLGVSFYNSSQQKKIQQEKAEIEAIHKAEIIDSLAQVVLAEEAEGRMQKAESNEDPQTSAPTPHTFLLARPHHKHRIHSGNQ